MASLAAAQQAVVDRVGAPHAREDRARAPPSTTAAGANPVESWRELRRDGFLAAAIPTAHGGLGLDMPTYVAVIRTIAQRLRQHRHDRAHALDRHALHRRARHRRPEAALLRARSSTHGRLFGSWGSEPAVSLSRTFLMETARHARTATDYVVDGVKHFCTMALGASHYMVWCALDGGTDMGKALLQVLVPADAPGITTDGKWDTLGMRATFSPSVTFTGVRVPARRRARRSGRGHPGRRRGELRPRLCRRLRRHRGGVARLRHRLRRRSAS